MTTPPEPPDVEPPYMGIIIGSSPLSAPASVYPSPENITLHPGRLSVLPGLSLHRKPQVTIHLYGESEYTEVRVASALARKLARWLVESAASADKSAGEPVSPFRLSWPPE